MRVHLVDGTWELFRSYFAVPKAQSADGQEVGAVRGLLRTLHALIEEDEVTHIACAFDTVIESFRNELFDGYKTSAGVPEDLLAQFPLAEEACRAMGVACWPMVEMEADDALATAVAALAAREEVEQVVICTPDKDLAQCVQGERVVQWDRKAKVLRGEAEVVERFGVGPQSIPDWLALVGDTADGIPGLPRWGEKSAATVLARYERIEVIPGEASEWDVKVRGAETLAKILREGLQDALLYRELATLRTDAPIDTRPEALRWEGADRDALAELCERLRERRLLERVRRWR